METTTNTSAPVRFSPSAQAELRRILQASADSDKQYLRVGVKGGGCSGLSYILEVSGREATDEFHEIDGIPCVINPAHGIYLYGMEIDWGTGLDARGFVFTNPNASATCGCGSSFAV